MICAVVTRREELAEAVAGEADLVELRADIIGNALDTLLDECPLPVVLTCRPTWAGGRFDGAEEERAALLERAAPRAAYVDLELGFEQRVALPDGCKRIVSHHDFERTPSDLHALARRIAATGADVVKLAVRTERYADVARLLALPTALDRPCVAIGMGPPGLVTRIAYRKYGNLLTYAPAGAATAPGQVPLRALQGYRPRTIGPSTRLFGLVGSPVAHSSSPLLHNAAFLDAGLDARYLPFEVSDVEEFVAHWPAGLEGVSVTMPWKERIVPLLDEVEGGAAAVNTVLLRDGRLWGADTDGPAALFALREAGPVEGRTALLLGNGGAAAAAGAALRGAGASTLVCARHPRPGERPWAERTSLEADILINATPIGMAPEPGRTPMPAEALPRFGLVFDLVYNPRRTRLLEEACAAGCRTVGGERMFLHQAARQFELWSGGRAAPIALWERLLR